jgi:uncharacterized membrane protein
MEWVFVYAPPLLAVWVAGSAALLLAFFVPIPGTSFWGRWALGMLVILVLPTIAYVVWSRVRR